MTFIQKGFIEFAIIAGVVGFVALISWHYGASGVQADWDAAKQDQQQVVITSRLNDAVATVQVITKYVDKIKVVREQGQTIIEQVPIYVTQENDNHAVINNGFVSLWNAANSGLPPGPPGAADAAASGIKLSEVAEQHSIEAGYCREVEEQLTALQDWLADER